MLERFLFRFDEFEGALEFIFIILLASCARKLCYYIDTKHKNGCTQIRAGSCIFSFVITGKSNRRFRVLGHSLKAKQSQCVE